MFISDVKLGILTWGSMTLFWSQPQVAIEEQVLETALVSFFSSDGSCLVSSTSTFTLNYQNFT